jgi:hypothetical protein
LCYSSHAHWVFHRFDCSPEAQGALAGGIGTRPAPLERAQGAAVEGPPACGTKGLVAQGAFVEPSVATLGSSALFKDPDAQGAAVEFCTLAVAAVWEGWLAVWTLGVASEASGSLSHRKRDPKGKC